MTETLSPASGRFEFGILDFEFASDLVLGIWDLLEFGSF
jgi:hypothetical protein